MPVGLCRRHLIISNVQRLLDELLGHFNSLFGDDESNIISLVDQEAVQLCARSDVFSKSLRFRIRDRPLDKIPTLAGA